MTSKEQALAICEMLYNKKAHDILAIHVAEKTIIADYFIIASGNVPTQTKALADEVEDRAGELGMQVRRKEGYAEGRWIVLDFGDVLVHIFMPEERKYYNMERLWDEDNNAINYSLEHGED